MICATPRTGTNLLCEALAKTGVTGRPDEYFGHMHVQRWKKKWQVESAVDYIQSLKNEAQTENGIWGVKVMMQYYDDLYSLLSDAHEDKTIGRFDIVERTFSELNYVWMTRRDKIAQAISLHKAYQDFVWAVDKGDIPPDEKELIFDFKEIDRILFEITRNETEWEEYFQSVGRRPFIVVYEDFIENYEATVNSVLDHLGIQFKFKGKIGESRFQRQWNQLSENWRNRYLKEKQEAQQDGASTGASCRAGP